MSSTSAAMAMSNNTAFVDEVSHAVWIVYGKSFIFVLVAISVLFLISGCLFAYAVSVGSIKFPATIARIAQLENSAMKQRLTRIDRQQHRRPAAFRNVHEPKMAKIDDRMTETVELETQGSHGFRFGFGDGFDVVYDRNPPVYKKNAN